MKEKLTILLIGQDLEQIVSEIQSNGSLTSMSTLFEAQQFLSHSPSDIILLDLDLSDSSGLNAFLFIHNKFPSIPIILIGENEENLAREAIHQGAQDYIPKKELSAKLLSRVIRYAIERQQLHENLKTMMSTDELTGLYNRRGFMTLLETQLSLSRRTNQGFYLTLLDLDYLKKINDTHGHLVGDLALKETAKILKLAFRGHDIIGRIGGDEFAVLAVGAEKEGIKKIKQHIRMILDRYNNESHQLFSLSLSIGCAYYDHDENPSMSSLFKKADEDLYEEKKLLHRLRKQ